MNKNVLFNKNNDIIYDTHAFTIFLLLKVFKLHTCARAPHI